MYFINNWSSLVVIIRIEWDPLAPNAMVTFAEKQLVSALEKVTHMSLKEDKERFSEKLLMQGSGYRLYLKRHVDNFDPVTNLE